MKAAELLRLYEAGQRDFRGENLRGQRFCDRDLSEADFSGADIRSADFSHARLIGSSFNNAEAGLQRRWAVGLAIASFSLAGVSGFFAAVIGYFASLIFDSGSLDSQIAGWTALIFLFVFCSLVLRRGLSAVAGIGAVLGGIVGAIASVDAGTVTVAVAVSVAGAGAVIGAITVAVAVAGAICVGGVWVGAGAAGAAVSVAGFVGVAVSVAGTTAGAVSIAVSALLTLINPYIGHRAIRGNPRDVWIRAAAIAFATIGGTNFRCADLTDATFSNATLKSTDFRGATLTRTCFKGARMLERIRPGNTYLKMPKIQALLSTGNGDDQKFDDLPNLRGLNLSDASLVNADFSGSNLEGSILRGAHLVNAIFNTANLNHADLQDANLTNAKLVQTQLDHANLAGTTLTGATLEDWGITTQTKLDGIWCDYVFMRLPPAGHPDPNPRRKPDNWNENFSEGEFTDFIAPMVETLDLYHNQAATPYAVAIAFHELRQQNPDAELDLISVEKRGKNRDKFLLRAEASSRADLSQLHGQYFERYNHLLTLPPEAILELLLEKDKQVQMLAGMVGTAIERPSEMYVNTYQNEGDTIVAEQGSQASKYNLSNAQFAGGFAETVHGDQVGGVINNCGASLDDITRLLTSLREQAQSLPDEQKNDALDVIDTIETDLQKSDPDPKRIGRWLKRLAAIATAAGTVASGTVAFSDDLNQFTKNIFELTETLGIPIDQV